MKSVWCLLLLCVSSEIFCSDVTVAAISQRLPFQDRHVGLYCKLREWVQCEDESDCNVEKIEKKLKALETEPQSMFSLLNCANTEGVTLFQDAKAHNKNAYNRLILCLLCLDNHHHKSLLNDVNFSVTLADVFNSIKLGEQSNDYWHRLNSTVATWVAERIDENLKKEAHGILVRKMRSHKDKSTIHEMFYDLQELLLDIQIIDENDNLNVNEVYEVKEVNENELEDRDVNATSSSHQKNARQLLWRKWYQGKIAARVVG